MAEEVQAPLSGKIWTIAVAVGDTVEEDDELLVIEAIKMENPVYAPCDGKVVEIRVKQGDQVDEDDVIVVIE
jgi:acetyl-CoA carboxylase biotin carboxyl carrier protein